VGAVTLPLYDASAAVAKLGSELALVQLLDDPRSDDWVETIERWQDARECVALDVWHGGVR
jgi:hypothetical protein